MQVEANIHADEMSTRFHDVLSYENPSAAGFREMKTWTENGGIDESSSSSFVSDPAAHGMLEHESEFDNFVGAISSHAFSLSRRFSRVGNNKALRQRLPDS